MRKINVKVPIALGDMGTKEMLYIAEKLIAEINEGKILDKKLTIIRE